VPAQEIRGVIAFLCDTCLSFFYTCCTFLILSGSLFSFVPTSFSFTFLNFKFKFQIHNPNFKNPNSPPLSYSLPQQSALSFSLPHLLSNSHCHSTSLSHSHSPSCQIQTLPIALNVPHFFKKG